MDVRTGKRKGGKSGGEVESKASEHCVPLRFTIPGVAFGAEGAACDSLVVSVHSLLEDFCILYRTGSGQNSREERQDKGSALAGDGYRPLTDDLDFPWEA